MVLERRGCAGQVVRHRQEIVVEEDHSVDGVLRQAVQDGVALVAQPRLDASELDTVHGQQSGDVRGLGMADDDAARLLGLPLQFKDDLLQHGGTSLGGDADRDAEIGDHER